MFSPIPAETPLRSHLDGARRNHRHLQRIAEIRKQRRNDRPLRYFQVGEHAAAVMGNRRPVNGAGSPLTNSSTNSSTNDAQT